MNAIVIPLMSSLLIVSCLPTAPKTSKSEEPKPSIASPSASSLKVYSCKMKRQNTEVLCIRYSVTANLVSKLKQSCGQADQTDGLTRFWSESDCSEAMKTRPKCEQPTEVKGLSTIVYGSSVCGQSPSTDDTNSPATWTNQTGAVPGSSESLACLAELISNVTGTWQPISTQDYINVELRSYTTVSSDPDKNFRIRFDSRGPSTVIDFLKQETACAKTDKTYKLFQSSDSENKSFDITVKDKKNLILDLVSAKNGQDKTKIKIDVLSK
jgi:hypothetical protein